MEEKRKLMFPLDIQLFAEGGNEEEEEEEIEEEDVDDEEDIDDEDGKKKKKEKTFTQKEVNRLTSKEKRQGRLAAYRALGIDPRNKEQVAKAKELLKGLNTSGNEESEDGKKNEAKNNKVSEEAERKLLEADCKIKAIELNALPRCIDDIVVLVLAKMADGDDIGEVMAEIKETHPSMFGKASSKAKEKESNDDEEDEDDSTENKGSKNKKYTGKSLGEFKKRVSKETDSKSLGQSLAKMRKHKAVKKSMFD